MSLFKYLTLCSYFSSMLSPNSSYNILRISLSFDFICVYSLLISLKNPFVIPGIREITVDSQLNLHQNFDNFVEGESNRFARSAGISVANKPGGTAFNPLFIFGGVT